MVQNGSIIRIHIYRTTYRNKSQVNNGNEHEKNLPNNNAIIIIKYLFILTKWHRNCRTECAGTQKKNTRIKAPTTTTATITPVFTGSHLV